MREAERRDLQKLCEAMLYGEGGAPGLGDLIVNLETGGKVPERIMGVLIRFGRLRETLQLLAEAGGDARDMRQSQIVVANKLRALMRRQENEVRRAIESEASRTARGLSNQIKKEPSRSRIRKEWFPFGSERSYEDFMRELDSACYLQSALEYLDFRADISPWTGVARTYGPKITFLTGEARKRGYAELQPHPSEFWWRESRWEASEEGPEPVYETFRGRATTQAMGTIAVIGLALALLGFASLSWGIVAPFSFCIVTGLLAVVIAIVLLSWHFKEVRVSARKIEYWTGKRRVFEAPWKDVVSVKIGRRITHLSSTAYGSRDLDHWDMDGDGSLSTLELGLEVFSEAEEFSREYERIDYRILIRTTNGDLELESGWGFTPWTIQRIFDAIRRVQVSYPHIRLIDTRRWKREW